MLDSKCPTHRQLSGILRVTPKRIAPSRTHIYMQKKKKWNWKMIGNFSIRKHKRNFLVYKTSGALQSPNSPRRHRVSVVVFAPSMAASLNFTFFTFRILRHQFTSREGENQNQCYRSVFIQVFRGWFSSNEWSKKKKIVSCLMAFTIKFIFFLLILGKKNCSIEFSFIHYLIMLVLVARKGRQKTHEKERNLIE